jgi:hypothetical protein
MASTVISSSAALDQLRSLTGHMTLESMLEPDDDDDEADGGAAGGSSGKKARKKRAKAAKAKAAAAAEAAAAASTSDTPTTGMFAGVSIEEQWDVAERMVEEIKGAQNKHKVGDKFCARAILILYSRRTHCVLSVRTLCSRRTHSVFTYLLCVYAVPTRCSHCVHAVLSATLSLSLFTLY